MPQASVCTVGIFIIFRKTMREYPAEIIAGETNEILENSLQPNERMK